MSLEWNSQEFDQQFHAVLIVVIDWSILQDGTTGLEDLVHIIQILWVGLDTEVHECHLEFEQSRDVDGLALILNDLVDVFLEVLENIKATSKLANFLGGLGLLTRTS